MNSLISEGLSCKGGDTMSCVKYLCAYGTAFLLDNCVVVKRHAKTIAKRN